MTAAAAIAQFARQFEEGYGAWARGADEDELRRARTVALNVATDVARDRAQASGTHPGADAIIATARDFFDFIWSGK